MIVKYMNILIVAVVVDDENLVFRIEFSDTFVTLLPIYAVFFVVYMSKNDEPE